MAVYNNLAQDKPKQHFTLGIEDDIHHSSLRDAPSVKVSPEGLYAAKFYGLGSDGTVGANKNSIKIIGESTDKFCQGYFAYDSKKSGGFTASHLRFGNSPIRSTYLINRPDFVACHVTSYIYKYDVLKGLKPGGVFLLNSPWDSATTSEKLPPAMQHYLAKHNIRCFIINASQIGQELGLGKRTNTIMQSAFFKVAAVIPYDLAVAEMKKAIVKSYGKKGEKVVGMNFAAVEAGGQGVVEIKIPNEWKKPPPEKSPNSSAPTRPEFIRRICDPINSQNGNSLPVSAFRGREDGTFPHGTAAWEKRATAAQVPHWRAETCIQCNQCAYVCPHACIRPFLLDAQEVAKAPSSIETIPAKGKGLEGLHYRIQVAIEDCTGCDNCVAACPTQIKSLELQPTEEQALQKHHWQYLFHTVTNKDDRFEPTANVKSSQFAQPLFEFSGACAGCGETPYIKLVTQLFGEHMIIANATGCSSIYGASAPSTPYTTHKTSGCGPAWANSLFEDNAEFGFGINEGVQTQRDRLELLIRNALSQNSLPEATAKAFNEWLSVKEDRLASCAAGNEITRLLQGREDSLSRDILALKGYLGKKSIWIIGGDGWAYDIGYGGLDHVLASGRDLNVLVLDTEVYSNTGGQASKSTPLGALAKFAINGKQARKKNLGLMAMAYGHVYVAQIAMGASQFQCLKALREAESYPGPSLIIAYSPCIEHGIAHGMTRTQQEAKAAVDCGYWNLFRCDPRREAEGKAPFQLDSKKPNFDQFQNFLNGEARFKALARNNPKEAEALYQSALIEAERLHQKYQFQAAFSFKKD